MFLSKCKDIESSIDKILNGNFEEIVSDENIRNRFKNIALLADENIKNREIVRQIIKDIFLLAGSMSNFYLNLDYEGEKIKENTKSLREISEVLASSFVEISKSQEEVASASSDVSQSLQSIVSRVDVMEKNAIDNANKILEIDKKIEEIHNDAINMKQNVRDLIETSKSVMNALSGISDIANQTNLLALNASIEAARSGEAGRGFAVVADEIRKLSDNTKKLLEDIPDYLNNINRFSKESENSVESTTKNIISIKENIKDMNKSILDDKSSIEDIASNISQISAFSEEFTASAQEVSSTIHQITETVENVAASSIHLDEIGKGILNVSKTLKEVEKIADRLSEKSGLLSNNPFYNLENEDFINIFSGAMNAHKKWMSNLKNMVDEMKVVPLQTDHTRCQFGHYYSNLNPVHSEVLKLWERIDIFHLNVHKSGDGAIDAIKRNDKEKANYYYNEARKNSLELFKIFDELTKKAREIDSKKECIFCIR
ncbi:methyl-accepting chemotaxis protein [Alkalithermobacter paradoxus]|uniref:Methyl-accepting chemotaxis protein 4 n=1 Tax=Alkalithermobacter paradoxus TaxID=29349 RepID=A0A1V4I5J9_9FIRM|nr:methyl-accepting chemotaxis protein 4 [[Clostridium] thermoalcaliphilum]